MSNTLRITERFILEEYENPKIKDFINSFEDQHDKDVVAETVTYLMNQFPEIAPTLKGNLVKREVFDGNYCGG